MAAPSRTVPQAAFPPSYYGMAPAPRSDALLRRTVLDVHNRERMALGVAAIAWDDALAADAARYARQMARTNIFRHSGRADRAIDAGENLWMGSRDLYGYDVMMDGFVQERRVFRARGRFPDISSTGNWQDAGHYSQMVWRGTQKVGCALGEGARFDYLVCRYFPAGNMYGMGPLDAPAPAVLAGRGR